VLVYAALIASVAWILTRLARAPLEIPAGAGGIAPILAGASRPERQDER
jgi:hypothetical protein